MAVVTVAWTHSDWGALSKPPPLKPAHSQGHTGVLTDTVRLRRAVWLVVLDSTPFLNFVESHSWPGRPQGYISQTYTQQLKALLGTERKVISLFAAFYATLLLSRLYLGNIWLLIWIRLVWQLGFTSSLIGVLQQITTVFCKRVKWRLA